MVAGFDHPDPDPEEIFSIVSSFMPGVLITGVVVAIIHFCWFYSLGNFLHKKLPSAVTMPVRTFRAFVIIPALYSIIASVLAFYFVQYVFSVIPHHIHNAHYFDDNGIPAFFFIPLLLIPVHLFMAFCMFYTFYFVAKCFKAVEKQRGVTTGDYIGEFFLMWFSFVGVWLIQPKINRLAAEE